MLGLSDATNTASADVFAARPLFGSTGTMTRWQNAHCE